MTRSHRDSRRASVPPAHSGPNRSSNRNAKRVPLAFELLEPRTLLHGGWLTGLLPEAANAANSATELVSVAQTPDSMHGAFAHHGGQVTAWAMATSDAHGDFHECCRPLSTMTVAGEETVNTTVATPATDLHGDDHECCRPQAATATSGPLTLTATRMHATGAVADHDETGDHHDCCRPLPAAPVTGEGFAGAAVTATDLHGDDHECCRPQATGATSGPLTLTVTRTHAIGAVANHDETGDHHDCCRPLPAAPSTTQAKPAGDSEAAFDRPTVFLATPSTVENANSPPSAPLETNGSGLETAWQAFFAHLDFTDALAGKVETSTTLQSHTVRTTADRSHADDVFNAIVGKQDSTDTNERASVNLSDREEQTSDQAEAGDTLLPDSPLAGVL